MEDFIEIPTDLAKEFVEWADRKSFCNSGNHICDRLANYLGSFLEKLNDSPNKRG